MLSTYPGRTGPRPATGRHAAAEQDPAPPAPPRWWRRWSSGAGADLSVDGGHLVVRVRGALDEPAAAQLADRVGELRLHQVVVVHLGGCDFVNVRGFRALLHLQDQVLLHGGRLLVLDPPRTLRIMCTAVPGRLTLVPDSVPDSAPPSGQVRT